VAGIAWELGVLAGLRDAGVDATGADIVVGTSAGSAVGAQIRSGVDLEELFAAQQIPADQSSERPVEFDMEELFAAVADAARGAADVREVRARVGARALAAGTVPEADRRAIIAARLPTQEWPDRPLLVTAVDAHTGDDIVFDRASGVPLVDAIAASCAVPGVWPPVTIGGRRFIDGGMRSFTSADLAAGHERVLVLAPMPDVQIPLAGGLSDEIALLEEHSRVLVIAPDEPSLSAMGRNPLDPATRAPSAGAGRRQAAALADAARALWSGD
jgi:NTE family protein